MRRAPGPPEGPIVALVPAYERADSVAATVVALRALERVDEVVVVDDGSRDATADVARDAGARVVQLGANVGKGGAVAAGIAATPNARSTCWSTPTSAPPPPPRARCSIPFSRTRST